MPSRLIVRCVPIKRVWPHPDPEVHSLIMTEVMGWQVCEQKASNPQVGDLRVFIPPDSILPDELVEELGVKKYLRKHNRVGQVRLRGEMSFGLSVPNRWGFDIGEEVSEKLGITKYEPPPNLIAGDQESPHPLFATYCSIDNFRNFPDEFQEGEDVLIMEKIEGTNSRVGLVWNDETQLYDPMIGSHNTQRKINNDPKAKSLYQIPLDNKQVHAALHKVAAEHEAKVVIFFGELFGGSTPNGAKSMRYGRNKTSYRLFDIYVDGKYLDAKDLGETALFYGLDLAPVLYAGPFSMETLVELANLPTKLMKEPHLSEGLVIRPMKERTYDEGHRLILKYKSPAYEELKSRGKAE